MSRDPFVYRSCQSNYIWYLRRAGHKLNSPNRKCRSASEPVKLGKHSGFTVCGWSNRMRVTNIVTVVLWRLKQNSVAANVGVLTASLFNWAIWLAPLSFSITLCLSVCLSVCSSLSAFMTSGIIACPVVRNVTRLIDQRRVWRGSPGPSAR